MSNGCCGKVRLSFLSHKLTPLRIAGAGLLLGGCAGGVENEWPPATSEACEAIVGGTADTEQAAVAALLSVEKELACTATLVGEIGGRSALLTAAHCLNHALATAVFGERYGEAESVARAGIATAFIHPSFDASTGEFDFALVVIDRSIEAELGVGALPIAERDKLTLGAQVTFVGFGETETGFTDASRHRVDGTVAALTPTTFAYEQRDGGPCFGDSGGPALGPDDTGIAVVGVTSYGEQGCWSRGVSARTSAAHDFVQTLLDPRGAGCARGKPH